MSARAVRWSWLQFAFMFFVAGGITFLHLTPPFDGLAIHLLKTFSVGVVCGCVAGRFGDAAWQVFSRVLRGW